MTNEIFCPVCRRHKKPECFARVAAGHGQNNQCNACKEKFDKSAAFRKARKISDVQAMKAHKKKIEKYVRNPFVKVPQ